MKPFIQRAVSAALLAVVMGCSATGGGNIQDAGNAKPASAHGAAAQVNNAATLRFSQYIDQRQAGNPRFLGLIATRVYGVSGKELILDQDVAVIATAAIKNRFAAEGFKILESEDANNALFDVSGVIKELTLNVNNRDDISISIETTVKDVATGKTVWSGLVTEKNDRFAGISGNNKADVDTYLKKGLRVVSGKTVEAVSASLMVGRPELFNLTPGTKAIKGVEVYAAPPASMVQPASPVALGAKPETSSVNAAAGMLSVNTNPPRAKVYLDGVYFGLSPLRSEIEPGVHDVVVKLNGYRTATEKVSVRKGDSTELELALER